MTKKIVLVDGVNILGEMVERALKKESSLEVVKRYQSSDALAIHLDYGGSLDADEILIMGSGDEASLFAKQMLQRLPGVRMFNLAADGSKVTLRWMEKEVIQGLTLPELIAVLRRE